MNSQNEILIDDTKKFYSTLILNNFSNFRIMSYHEIHSNKDLSKSISKKEIISWINDIHPCFSLNDLVTPFNSNFNQYSMS